MRNRIIIIVFIGIIFSIILSANYAYANCCQKDDCYKSGSKPKIYVILVSGPGQPNSVDRELEESTFSADIDYIEKTLRQLFSSDRLVIMKIKYDRNKPFLINSKLKSFMNYATSRARNCDITLFVFSGHGYPREIVISTKDGKLQTMKSFEISKFLTNINGRKIVIIDACGSGETINKIIPDSGASSSNIRNSILIASSFYGEAAECYLKTNKLNFIPIYTDSLKSLASQGYCNFGIAAEYMQGVSSRTIRTSESNTQIGTPCNCY